MAILHCIDVDEVKAVFEYQVHMYIQMGCVTAEMSLKSQIVATEICVHDFKQAL